MHVQSKTNGNGIHKRRLNGEDTFEPGIFSSTELVAEIQRVMSAVRSGQVHERARLEAFMPEERAVLEEINDSLEVLTTPFAFVVEYLGSLGKGELPEKITADFPGELNTLKQKLNEGVELFALLPETAEALKRLEANDHTVSVQEECPGIFGQVGHGVNALRDRMKSVVARLQHIAAGEFQGELKEVQSIGKRSEQDALLPAFLDTMLALTSLTDQMRHMAEEHDRGEIDATIDASKFGGVYREVAQGINNMVAGHISLNSKAMACVAEFGKGSFDAPLEQFPGKKAFINETIERVRTNLKALIRDANMLVEAAVAGKLSTRADATKHGGDFAKIVEGVNETLDAVIAPLNVAAERIDKISKGEIPSKITENYAGDFNTLKNNLNACIDALAGLVETSTVLGKLAVNDCTVQVTGTYAGIFGRLAEATNTAQERVKNTVGILRNTAAGEFKKDLEDFCRSGSARKTMPSYQH